jgi:hypothetical protein
VAVTDLSLLRRCCLCHGGVQRLKVFGRFFAKFLFAVAVVSRSSNTLAHSEQVGSRSQQIRRFFRQKLSYCAAGGVVDRPLGLVRKVEILALYDS